MKKLQLKIKHELFNLECPESWEEIKVKHFIKLESDWDGQNMVKLLSILTGIEYEKIANSTTKTAQQFADLVQFVINNQPDFHNLEKKKAIVIDGVKIKMPKSLEFETFGQMDSMKDVLSQGKENVIKNIPRIMAIYCQPSLIGEFNENRLDEIEEKILELPILDVYAHCFFFYKRQIRYLQTGVTY
jgi:hypothetical protein